MLHTYTPRGVCSRKMDIEVDGEIIKSVRILGGCAGNTKGISILVEGMNINEAIRKLKGIDCGGKGTSCPDQLARALEAVKENLKI